MDLFGKQNSFREKDALTPFQDLIRTHLKPPPLKPCFECFFDTYTVHLAFLEIKQLSDPPKTPRVTQYNCGHFLNNLQQT